MNATIVLPQNIAEELRAATLNHLETAGVLLVSVVDTSNGNLRLLGREIHWVDQTAYDKREADGLSIQSHGYIHSLGRAEKLGVTPLWFHTHPGMESIPIPSNHDLVVNHQIADLFRLRSGSRYYGALILSPRSDGFTYTGHLESEEGKTVTIDRFWIVGDRLQLVMPFGSQVRGLSGVFDRNVRAFGAAIQQTLSYLQIGIVGCGGTGSSIAEQLVRLGVKHLLLIDPDELSASNISRVYGSAYSDIDKPKVEVLANSLSRIAPDLIIEQVQAMITLQPVAKRLTDCDIIFGCTDDNAGRLILSRVATYLLAPVIDCGVLITSSDSGELKGIDGRVTVLSPGQACLVCRGRIDMARAAAEFLTPEERVRRADEGYAPALERIEPAVVTFTTAIGATAINEMLERLIGYGPDPRPNEVLMRFHDREVSTNLAYPRELHYCHSSSGKVGIGITLPFLEQAWPT